MHDNIQELIGLQGIINAALRTKFMIALKALIDSNGDVGRAKAATRIRISARTWQNAIDEFRRAL